MYILKHTLYLAISSFCIFYTCQLQAQGIIINELSNGTFDHPSNGGREFIELLVVGDPANPIDPVDLTGWVIDDNNGDFEGSFGTGVSNGYVQITGTCLNNVAPGSLIVLYNNLNPSPSLPADDPTDANGDNVYVFPINNACFSSCATNPNAFGNTAYGCAALNNPADWATIAFDNAGDAVQTRDPGFTFFHGFSYGNVTTPFPLFPNGASSFNAGIFGTGSNYRFICGDWYANSNFGGGSASLNDSPGAANGAQNQTSINVLRAGLYDYGNLSNADNCGLILNAEITFFAAENAGDHILLSWEGIFTEKVDFTVERSLDGEKFKPIATFESLQNSYVYEDFELKQGYHYYRLRQTDANGQQSLTETRVVWIGLDQLKVASAFPNPGKNNLQLEISNREAQQVKIRLLSSHGVVSLEDTYELDPGINRLTIDTSNLASGMYVLLIQSDRGGKMLQRWVKE